MSVVLGYANHTFISSKLNVKSVLKRDVPVIFSIPENRRLKMLINKASQQFCIVGLITFVNQ